MKNEQFALTDIECTRRKKITRVSNRPKISVIIPVYNTAECLPQCLDSLLNQTYSDLEILCVDDGSTDNSWEVLQEYAEKDARMKIFRQENAGVSVARNRALEHAVGDFLSFIDSDDWLDLDTYEKCVEVIDGKIDVVFYGVQLEPECKRGNQEIVDLHLMPEHVGMQRINETTVLFKSGIVANKLMRKALIDRFNIRFADNISHGEDTAFCLCVLSVARCIYGLKNRFYHYLQRETSTTKRNKCPRAVDSLYSMEMVYEFWNSNHVYDEMKRYFPFLFWIQYSNVEKKIPDSLRDFVRTEALRLADKMDAYPLEKCAGYISILYQRLSWLERVFHWYRRDTECFGFFGKSIWSITYQPVIKVHRFLGRRVFQTKYKSLKV